MLEEIDYGKIDRVHLIHDRLKAHKLLPKVGQSIRIDQCMIGERTFRGEVYITCKRAREYIEPISERLNYRGVEVAVEIGDERIVLYYLPYESREMLSVYSTQEKIWLRRDGMSIRINKSDI